jgi:hypothetical protein
MKVSQYKSITAFNTDFKQHVDKLAQLGQPFPKGLTVSSFLIAIEDTYKDFATQKISAARARIPELTVLMAELQDEARRSSVQNDSKMSPFPFLRLPREIRDCIYRHLLSSRLTFTHAAYKYGDYRWPVRFAPAILRANKQISEEASRVLYTENDFVVLKVATHSRRYANFLYLFCTVFR